jgi:hypothetical protein
MAEKNSNKTFWRGFFPVQKSEAHPKEAITMAKDEIRTIVVPSDWGMLYDQETGRLYNPSEVEELVESGKVLNADGSTMTLEQYEALAYRTE